MASMVQKNSYVDDETLRCPVEHSTATDWDDATMESIAWLSSSTVWKTDVDSRTTAILNHSEDSFQRVLHEVLSRQQFHFRRASRHRVPAGSARAH